MGLQVLLWAYHRQSGNFTGWRSQLLYCLQLGHNGSMLSRWQKWFRIAGVILRLNVLSSTALLFWLTHNYQRTCPASPDEGRGIIFPLNEHGSIVYLDSAQHHTYLAACGYMIMSGLFFVGGVWMKQRNKDL